MHFSLTVDRRAAARAESDRDHVTENASAVARTAASGIVMSETDTTGSGASFDPFESFTMFIFKHIQSFAATSEIDMIGIYKWMTCHMFIAWAQGS